MTPQLSAIEKAIAGIPQPELARELRREGICDCGALATCTVSVPVTVGVEGA